MKQVEVRRRIAIRDFLQIPLKLGEAWPRTGPAKEMLCEWKGYNLEKKMYMKQAARLRDEALDNRPRARRFIELFTTLTNDNKCGAGSQDFAEQRRFRQKTIAAYNAKQPHLLSEDLWCPILCNYFPPSAMKATQIFSHRHGQKLMDEIFRPEEGQENGLFTPYNGLLMTAEAEERFRKGLFVIVPSLKTNDLLEEIGQWQASGPESYKIRVVDRKAYPMTRSPTGWLEKRWNDLDGRELEFRSDHRPRPPYLYFHYCVTMLRRSWCHTEHETVLQDRLGKRFWDIPGPYLRQRQLSALAEEIGNDGILEGAGSEAHDDEEVDRDDESDQITLAAANDAVRFSAGKGTEAFTNALNDEDDDDNDETWGKRFEIGVCPRCNCYRCSAVFGRDGSTDAYDEGDVEDDGDANEGGGAPGIIASMTV